MKTAFTTEQIEKYIARRAEVFARDTRARLARGEWKTVDIASTLYQQEFRGKEMHSHLRKYFPAAAGNYHAQARRGLEA